MMSLAFFSFSALDPALLALVAVLFLLALRLYRWRDSQDEILRSDLATRRFSNLCLSAAGLQESAEPERTLEKTLDLALDALHASVGCLEVRSSEPGGLNFTCARGLSATTLERLTDGPLSHYLTSGPERWGSPMVFRNLDRAEALAEWRRDPLFRRVHEMFSAEGIKTLGLTSLEASGKKHGVLIVGSSARKAFPVDQVRLMQALGQQIGLALENRLLHRTAERQQEELRVLRRLGEALSATFDPREQFQILERELSGLFGLRHISFILREGDGERARTTSRSNGGLQPPASDGLLDYVLRTGAPLNLSRNLLDEVRRLNIGSVDPRLRAWCGIPIQFSEGSRGVLVLAEDERDVFLDQRQFEFLQVLARDAGAAIENAQLFQKEQRRARHLALLNELGQKAASVLDRTKLLTSICPQIHQAFNYDFVWIETLDDEQEEWVVEAQAGIGRELVGHRTKLSDRPPDPALASREPDVFNQLQPGERFLAFDGRVRSAVSLPLVYGGVTFGNLIFASLEENSFPSADVLTLRTLADQLALALHNARAYQVAQEQAVTDGLTHLKTHRYFMESLAAECHRSPRVGQPFSLIMLDLDRFRAVNEKHGHAQGDKILISVARLLESRLRHSNIVARYGGDEFAILMPGATLEQAEILAERLCTGLASEPELAKHEVTASFGIAMYPLHGVTRDEILRVAQAGMYLAKHEMGHRVRVAAVSDQTPGNAWEQQFVRAYVGVAVKRLFPTGPEAFRQYYERFQQATQDPVDEGPSLLDTVTALAFAIDAKDHYTQGHSQSVSQFAAQIARAAGVPESQVEEIRLAGILHDIGKIGVPESVLNKPARLTSAEYEIMKSHATLGWKILEPLRVKAIERIRLIVRHHHERVDGTGYPDGLKGDEIPLGARVLTIADAYDSMVTHRAYQKGRSVEEAIAELRRCRGAHFDAHLVDAFLRVLGPAVESQQRATFLKAPD
jgi:diguanylate cyclase (GGDEF)-like protein/putative nucleotidyltransferase with HDIG domain